MTPIQAVPPGTGGGSIPGVQETVIFVARPPQQQQQSTLLTQQQQQSGGGVGGINNNNNNRQQSVISPQLATSITQAPLRIVVRQPQAPPPVVVTTPKPKNQLNKVIDAAVGQLSTNEFQTLLGSLPDLFQGIDAIVDGVEGFIGE